MGRRLFEDENNRKEYIMKRIEELEKEEGRTLSWKERVQLEDMHHRIIEIYTREEIFWRQRAKYK